MRPGSETGKYCGVTGLSSGFMLGACGVNLESDLGSDPSFASLLSE